MLIAGLVVWCTCIPDTALADRRHTVRRGQSLARIAKRHRVRVIDLATANRIKRDAMLRPGQVLVIPARGVVYVRAGDTLARLARRHGVGVGELAKKNRLRLTSPLRIGQRLVLPGFEVAAVRDRAEKRWGRPKRPGVARINRIWSKEAQRVSLVDRRGRVRRSAQRKLRHLMRPKTSRKRKIPHPRLVRLLAQISDHFGGRTVDIVSGYRLPGGYTKRSSRHVHAQAVDFRVRGVPLKVVRDYCSQFAHVGVGFYPRSRFVHLDVRRKDARWTDWSRPGDPPMRHPPGRAAPAPTRDTTSGDTPEAEDDGLAPVDEHPQAISDD